MTAILILTLLCSAYARAQEQITLTTPVVPPSIANYKGVSLFIQTQLAAPIVQAPRIVITIVGSDGQGHVFEYPCRNGCAAMDTDAEVQAVIVALNSTVNMNTRTLWRRIFDRLIVDFPERFPGGASVP